MANLLDQIKLLSKQDFEAIELTEAANVEENYLPCKVVVLVFLLMA